jgi:hypothetical protein
MVVRRETIAEAEARLLGFLLRGDIEGFERATARARRALALRKLAEYDDEFGDYEEFWDEDEIGGLPGCRLPAAFAMFARVPGGSGVERLRFPGQVRVGGAVLRGVPRHLRELPEVRSPAPPLELWADVAADAVTPHSYFSGRSAPTSPAARPRRRSFSGSPAG